jgi:hypothetical protein
VIAVAVDGGVHVVDKLMLPTIDAADLDYAHGRLYVKREPRLLQVTETGAGHGA